MGEGAEILSSLISELLNSLAISVESLSTAPDSLTWKKRGVLMKYGCGVCHSLGCIFVGLINIKSDGLKNSCSKAIHQLVACMERFRSLSHKMSLSAMAALGNLSSDNLSQLCEGSGFLGAGIATCSCLLVEVRNQLTT